MSGQLIFLIPLLPLAGALLNMVFGRFWSSRMTESVAITAVASSTVATALLWPLAGNAGTAAELFTWLQAGPLTVPFALRFDSLAACMALMVTGVSTLIHIYGIGYLERKEDRVRFFALLNLFVFAMLTVVLADNLLLMLLGWEGVGFCSYALIGYWYRDLKNAAAGRKAFLVTRCADLFLVAAFLWLFQLTGTLSIPAINQAPLETATVTGLALLLLAGACGKSAQLPFMTWLPDAMAGPTPVSALIHAATMVTAGVYLLCRMFPLISQSPTGMAVIAAIGTLTALYAATCALAQRDIKRLLAYSTMSQIGFMFLAVGAGTVSGAMFHLLTHAFFKALLFMAAGGIIHLAAGEMDLSRLGGLKRQSPLVYWTLLAGLLCLAGIPLTGGFFSKDAILAAAFARGDGYYVLLGLLGLVTALMTAMYSFRLLYLVGPSRGQRQGEPHHLPPSMLWTLIPLALLGLGGGLLNLPFGWGGNQWLARFLGGAPATVEAGHSLEIILGLAAGVLSLAGWLWAHWRYAKDVKDPGTGSATNFFLHGWQADRAVELLVLAPFRAMAGFWSTTVDEGLLEGGVSLPVRFSRGCGRLARGLTTGKLGHYLTALACGLGAIMIWVLLQTI
ncbi:MAG: NADH-quinone oxidoreductase subunit L [Syntrophotaleaceae bacterium]